ncbi:MAG: single-stranded DNA-binding protein [Sandaracinaceae bacterium]|nr:single-stranded DNA-binding protein [Sandaracinaceae bacterium]
MTPLGRISRDLAKSVDALRFGPPITHVYDPLAYAREPHERYLARWGNGRKQVILLGMNPGPFGMAQTGVPFGDPAMVRGWLGIEGEVGHPPHEHPKRKIEGLRSARAEVSGTRLWGWARDRFGTPDAFFARFFVVNYCPLVFMEKSGKNRTPDKLPASEAAPLYAACDHALRKIVALLEPEHVVGVGAFAEARARAALHERVSIGRILHPSPASPLANRDWAKQADQQLRALGVEV